MKSVQFPCKSYTLASMALIRGMKVRKTVDALNENKFVWWIEIETREDLQFITEYFEERNTTIKALETATNRFNQLNQ